MHKAREHVVEGVARGQATKSLERETKELGLHPGASELTGGLKEHGTHPHAFQKGHADSSEENRLEEGQGEQLAG